MSENEYEFGETGELAKREKELNEFLVRMFDEEDRPYFVSDEACIYDIFAGDDEEFSSRCLERYGRTLSPADFRMPVWKLLDLLHSTDR